MFSPASEESASVGNDRIRLGGVENMPSWRDVPVAIRDTSFDTAANNGYYDFRLTRIIAQQVSMITVIIAVVLVLCLCRRAET